MNQNPNHRKILTSSALVVLIALVLCISLGATSNSNQAADSEYKVISLRYLNRNMFNQAEPKFPEVQAEVIETTLNKLEKEGWELQNMNESFLILKRELP